MIINRTIERGSKTHDHINKLVEQWGNKARYVTNGSWYLIKGAKPKNATHFTLILESIL